MQLHKLPSNEFDNQFYIVSTNQTMHVLLLSILNHFLLIQKRSNNLIITKTMRRSFVPERELIKTKLFGDSFYLSYLGQFL